MRKGDTRLELGYALTVHKAQGSEFDTVFMVLPKSHHLVTRELIYTALTRQKGKIVILMEGTPTDLQRLSSVSFSRGCQPAHQPLFATQSRCCR